MWFIEFLLSEAKNWQGVTYSEYTSHNKMFLVGGHSKIFFGGGISEKPSEFEASERGSDPLF